MLAPINLLPWQNQRHYGRWPLTGSLIVLLLCLSAGGILAYINQSLQTNLHHLQQNLQQWQPSLRQWRQAEQQRQHVAAIKRWQMQWYCRWQSLLHTLPADITWQQAVFSIDQLYLKGQVTDPAVLNQWSQRMVYPIQQQSLQRHPDSRLFDFEVELKWIYSGHD